MMDDEISKNAAEFRTNLADALRANIAAINEKNSQKLDEAYARLTCLQSIRVSLLEGNTSSGALGFFTEAQGDGLTSQVLITSGSSRSALKSLRSLIENVIRAVYYADHPVEYRLWEAGKHRPTFKSLFDYLETHPDITALDPKLQSVSTLHSNWKKLSDAVHSSAKEERMSGEHDEITIWKTNQKSVGQWAIFQRAVLQDVCLLYLTLHASKLRGAALKPLRDSLKITIPAKLNSLILSELSVNLGKK